MKILTPPYQARDVFHRDISPSIGVGAGAYTEVLRLDLPDPTNTISTQRRTYGVALGGALPPGTYARVTSYGLRGLLGDESNPNVQIVRPGDAYVLDYPDGVAARVISPFAHAKPAGYDPSSMWYTTPAEAQLFCFLNPAVVANVRPIRVAGVADWDTAVPSGIPATTPSDGIIETLDTNAIEVPYDATSVMVHLWKYNGVDVPVRLDETYTVEVWWLTERRMWVHDGDDDFDGDGIGDADANHDHNVWSIGPGVRGMWLRRVTGGVTGYLNAHAIFGW